MNIGQNVCLDQFQVRFSCYDTQVSITGPSWPSYSVSPEVGREVVRGWGWGGGRSGRLGFNYPVVSTVQCIYQDWDGDKVLVLIPMGGGAWGHIFFYDYK